MSSQAGPRRRSGGPAPPVDDTTLRLQQFDDFRRRHSRQNREIITDNINRKTAMRNLQDQIEELQAEVLSVRAENSRLVDQVKRMQSDTARVRSDAARDALAGILAAVPALQELQAAMGSLEPAEPLPRPSAGPAAERVFANPMATRPAACAAEAVGLGVLDEVSEPSESPARRRRSSPHRPFTFTAPVKKSAYASPKRSPKRTPPRKRRRESGLLPRPASPDSDSSLSSPESAPAELAPLAPMPESEEWERAVGVLEFVPEMEDDGARTPTNRLGVKVKDIAAHLASIDIDSHAEARPAAAAERAEMAVDLGASASSRGSEPPELVEEEGGRSRRTRTSVSYKEPSLRKKMRKPDGASVDDVLGGGGKRILDTGVRRKSALPRSAAKIGLNDEQPLDLLSAPTRSKSRSTTPRATTPTTTPPSSSPKSSPSSKKRDTLGELSSNVLPPPAPTVTTATKGKRVSVTEPKRAGRRSAAA